MRLRVFQSWSWVRALAVLGLLMHAGLLVRHAVQVGGAGPLALHADGGFCDTSASGAGQRQVPQAPADKASCPICTGALSSAALLPGPLVAFEILTPWLPSDDGEATAPRVYGTGLPPPNRGPPSLIM